MRKKDMSRQQSGKVEIYAVISGSFSKFLLQIQKTIRSMEAIGITVISPKTTNKVGAQKGFVILEGDKGTPDQVEKHHLQAIGKSDFLYVVNPGGYIGESAALEIGYALSKGVPVYALTSPSEEVFAGLISSGIPSSKIKNEIAKKKKFAKLPLKTPLSLSKLQKYVSEMVRIRGFSEEGLIEVTLLLIEEVGELAKAIRFDQGLKLADEAIKHVKTIDSELADCLIYLLDIANLANVDFEKAFLEKEAANAKRKWQRAHTDNS